MMMQAEDAGGPRYVDLGLGALTKWPLPNVWLGVTAEDQQRADERIPLLLQVPAAVRWVSYEPGLGALNVEPWLECQACGYTHEDQRRHGDHGICGAASPGPNGGLNVLDWVVIGCESGPRARPFRRSWARSVAQQCKRAGVPCFTKQLPAESGGGGRLRKSAELAELGWPVQYPEAC
jgi:protein gp37